MPIGPKGPPQKPGLSIRGRVVFDTVRGVPRARPWPPKKPTKPGTKRHLTAKAFGAANRACKVTDAAFYGEHWEATRGTPLLPRDLMIAMMYGRAFALTLEDGRIIRSMASRNDVSTSLDMIGQTEGHILVRGEKYWELQAPADAAYQGAQRVNSTYRTSQNYSTTTKVPLNAIEHDEGGWTGTGAPADGFVVPEGVKVIEAFCVVGLDATTAGLPVNVQFGGTAIDSTTVLRVCSQPLLSSNNRVMAASGPVFVAAGDTIWGVIQTPSDTSVNLEDRTTRMWVKKIG